MRLHKNKRQLQAELTKQRILQTATQLFDQYGFDNVSIEDIAQEADCSVGGIYHYFSSKDEIAAHAITAYDDSTKLYFDEKVGENAANGLSGLEKLKEFMVYTHNICIKSGTLNHLFSLKLHHKDHHSLSLFDNQNYTKTLRNLIVQCRNDGYISDCHSDDEVFHLLTLATRGLFADWLFKKGTADEFDMDKLTRSFVDVIFSGLK